MRRWFMGWIVVLGAMTVFSLGIHAQSRATSQPGAAKAIPNLSGLWEVPLDPGRADVRRDVCGEPACRALLGLPPPQQLSKNNQEPQMLPWAEERYKAVREGVQDPNAFSNQALNPSWGGCMPEGPTESMRRRAFELRQFPDVVLLLFDHDHSVRRIYVDGRGHPDRPAATWMGHSIGRYDGEALVADTVNISDKAWIDVQGHPHTDALRVTERVRRLDQKTLEMQITIDDPKTYQKPWTKTVIHYLRPPGPQVWDQTECEELLQLGTHYSVESKK